MFIENKYTKWYFSIIENAKTRVLKEEIIEKHHIIPKSLGGKDLEENIVKLTPREHFICHLMLPRMLVGEPKAKMTYAIMMMKSKSRWLDRERVTKYSHKFKLFYSKIEFTQKHKENISKSLMGIKLGVPLSEEHKRKISIGNKGKNLGRKATEETKKILSLAHIGLSRNPHTEQTKKKIGDALRGKEKSEEHKINISKSQTGKKRGPHSAEHKKKISESNKGKFLGVPKNISDEERQRRRDWMRNMRANQSSKKD